jgi:c-di-GMP-binding flagellar brake protein YcgR
MNFFSRLKSGPEREHPRQPVRFDVLYGHGDDLTLTTAVDMSESGLAFVSKTLIPEGTKLDMRLIMIPEKQDDSIDVKSKVVRNQEARTAVAFDDLKSAHKQRIHDYIVQSDFEEK